MIRWIDATAKKDRRTVKGSKKIKPNRHKCDPMNPCPKCKKKRHSDQQSCRGEASNVKWADMQPTKKRRRRCDGLQKEVFVRICKQNAAYLKKLALEVFNADSEQEIKNLVYITGHFGDKIRSIMDSLKEIRAGMQGKFVKPTMAAWDDL